MNEKNPFKKILFLTNLLPYPGNSGGTKKTKKMLDFLIQEKHEIFLLFMYLPNQKQSELDSFIKEYSNNIFISKILNINNVRSIKNIIFSFFSNLPLNIYRNKNKQLYKNVQNILSTNNINLILCDHLEMFQYIPPQYYKITLLHEHNAEFMIWKRYSNYITNIFIKCYIELEAQRLKKYEIEACKNVKLILAAPADQEILNSSINDISKFKVSYHLGDDSLLKRSQLVKNKVFKILFIGTLTWEANSNGIFWFINKVFPLIAIKYNNVQLDIVGNFSDNITVPSDKRIIFHGFVEDIEPFFINSTVFICPLLFGSGMKIKVLEALYRGLPIVTTTVGAESIDLINDKNAYITDDPIVFSESIIKLYENDSTWNLFSRAGRELSFAKYTWQQENNRMQQIINMF